jgi:hypothetical protein
MADFSSLAKRQQDRARWWRGVVIGSFIALTALAWMVRACVKEQREREIAESHVDYQAFAQAQQRRAEEAMKQPALERREFFGMSIEMGAYASLDRDASPAWGRLQTAQLSNAADPYGNGVFVEWREATLSDRLPMPGDPVDSLFAHDNGNYTFVRGPVVRAGDTLEIAIEAYKRLHVIATYLQCGKRVVTIVAWHPDARTFSDRVVQSFRCGG